MAAAAARALASGPPIPSPLVALAALRCAAALDCPSSDGATLEAVLSTVDPFEVERALDATARTPMVPHAVTRGIVSVCAPVCGVCMSAQWCAHIT